MILYLDTSALVKRYHLELGTEIVDAVFAENSSTKMISDLQETCAHTENAERNFYAVFSADIGLGVS